MKGVFDVLMEHCKSLPAKEPDAFKELEPEVKAKKRNEGWANVEIANRKRLVGRDRRELGL